MIVYHGSAVIVQQPDTQHSFRPLDFGKGFYATTVKDQAERWARRTADLRGGKALVNQYEMLEDMSSLRIRIFAYDLEEWIAFISQPAIDGLLRFQHAWEVRIWTSLCWKEFTRRTWRSA